MVTRAAGLFAVIALAVLPMCAFADSVNVSNRVSAHASSGGNVNSGDSTVEGESSASVSVKTIVNGKVVDDYEETKTGTDDVSASYEGTYESKGSSVSTSATADVTSSASGVAEDTNDTRGSLGGDGDAGQIRTGMNADASAVASAPAVERKTSATTTSDERPKESDRGLFGLITRFFKYVASFFA